MPNRILEDHKHFRDIIQGKTGKELSRLISGGGFVKKRPKGGKIRVPVPGIEQPKYVYGENPKNGGIGRGKGKDGDVKGYEPGKGDGSGGGAGEDHADGITVGVDLSHFLQFLRDELALPPMKPKPNQTFEETKIRYNDISRIGPDSLRHNRRTMYEAMKRLACTGDLQKTHLLPGCQIPMSLITPINQDKRYRTYQEEKIPTSNAMIFFIRDCSGSMDPYRCGIVSDMSWWIDAWISQYYQRMERTYIIHDTRAEEVSQERFYGYSGGGGTLCSSGFKLVADILENRVPPSQYNIYIFYFSDGENFGDKDNNKIIEMMEGPLGPDIVNMVGFTEICPYGWGGYTLKDYLDEHFKIENHVSTRSGFEHVRTAMIGQKTEWSWGGNGIDMGPDERDRQIIEAIKSIIGKERVFK